VWKLLKATTGKMVILTVKFGSCKTIHKSTGSTTTIYIYNKEEKENIWNLK